MSRLTLRTAACLALACLAVACGPAVDEPEEYQDPAREPAVPVETGDAQDVDGPRAEPEAEGTGDSQSGGPTDPTLPEDGHPPPPSPLASAVPFPPLEDAGEGRLLPQRFAGADAPGQVRDYWLYLPPGYEGAGPWPLLLYLHGRSHRGDDLETLKGYGIVEILARGLDLPFVVVAPQLPDGQRWTDMARLGELVRDVMARHSVDPDRVYATGYSMGAGGAWRFTAAHADLLAAAVPVAATTPRPAEAMLNALERVPLRVYHGTADEAASWDDAVRMVRALEQRGAPVELVALEGEDHNIVTAVYSDPSLYHWLLGHRRGLVDLPPTR